MLRTPQGTAAARARAILAIETRLAEAALDRTVRRDPAATDHMMTTAEWRALAPGHRLVDVCGGRGRPGLRTAQRRGPGLSEGLNALVVSTPLDELKAYLTWQLLNGVGRHAAEDVRGRRFRFLQPDARRPAGAAAAVAALRHTDGQPPGRGARQGLRRAGVRRRPQGRHPRHGRGHQGRDEKGHRRGAVDERANETRRP